MRSLSLLEFRVRDFKDFPELVNTGYCVERNEYLINKWKAEIHLNFSCSVLFVLFGGRISSMSQDN